MNKKEIEFNTSHTEEPEQQKEISEQNFQQRLEKLKERLSAGDVELIEKLEKELDKWKALATIDPLTNIYNRRGFDREVERLLNILERENKTIEGVAFLMIDLDNFKKINDRLGHDIGDNVLTMCAALLEESVRDADIVGRWGGDEFIIALKDVTIEEAKGVAAKLKKEIGEMEINGKKLKELFEDVIIGASIGVAMPEPTVSSENFNLSEVIKKTDITMYQDKKNK